jgi:protoheme IX farnesyltransferase
MKKTSGVGNGLLGLALAATIAIFLLMAAGSAARVLADAGSGYGCPDWPTCFGRFAPPAGTTLAEPAGAQMLHRALAGLAALLTTAAAAWAVRTRAGRSITGPLAASAALMLAQAALGSLYFRPATPALLSPLHLGLALAALGLSGAAVTALFFRRAAAQPAQTASRPFGRLARLTLAALFLLLVSGALVSVTGAGQECTGWPLCAGTGLPASPLGWLAFAHRLVVLGAGALLALQFIAGWTAHRRERVLLPAATAAFLLLLGQAFLGALIAARGFPADLVGLHSAAAAALWVTQAVLVTATAYRLPEPQGEAQAREDTPLPRRRVLDFVILSKPIIVALLLVTTYAGMVVGGRAIPEAALVFWTLLGGALAAGGSSALNQYIDREIDKDMQRTAQRPIPAGRLTPAEGLAYGVGACLAAFFVLAGMVNLLAALLSLAGMVYYVLIYSIWLKHRSVQNIVIGGGAGAIPPLVGWAAATGALNVPSLFLFAIIFFWTPPHFWALALVRRKDYARGRVPMLPVIRGEAETRKQILIYTIELVALTLLMPILKLAGTVYLISALVLGLWLISTAWRVYRDEGNKQAWKMYRYSSMYLMFLMIAMVADVLI